MRSRQKVKFVSIQAKVSPEAAACLDRIVKEYKFSSRYEIMQYLLSVFLSFADPNHKETEDIDVAAITDMARVFEGFENSKERVITTKPRGGKTLRLKGAVYVFSEVGKRGYVVRNMETEGESMRVNGRTDAALLFIIKHLYPKLARRLEDIGRSLGISRLEDIINEIIDSREMTEEDRISDEIRRDMEAEQSSIRYGIVPKRARRRSAKDE